MPPQPALPWHPAFVLSKDKSDGFSHGVGNSALRALSCWSLQRAGRVVKASLTPGFLQWLFFMGEQQQRFCGRESVGDVWSEDTA